MQHRIYSILVVAMLLASSFAAQARLYQWENPSTGTVELSGTPPAWYRGTSGGPRILVFENGILFDDTAIVVEPGLGGELREAAFREFERRQQDEALKRLERAARRERARQREDAEREAEALAAVEVSPALSPVEAAVDEVPEILDPVVVDRLKTLLQAWDRQQVGN